MNEEIQDLLSRGIDLMGMERYEDAVELYKGVLEADKSNYEAHLNLGNAYMNLGRLEDGIGEFKKALLADPESGEARYSLGCAHFVAGHNPEAVKEFNRCEERGFAPLEMYEILETIFVDADDPTQAIRYANKAIQANPLLPDHYINKAQFYLLLQKPKEAAAVLREVQGLLPDAAEPYVIEAQIHLQMGDFDQAVAVCDRALNRFPEDPTLLLEKGRVLNQMGKSDEALELLDKASDLAGEDSPLSGDIDAERGVAYATKQDFEKSVECLRRVVFSQSDRRDEASFMLLTELAALEDYGQIASCSDEVLAIDGVSPRSRAAAVFWKAYASKKLGSAEADGLLKDAAGELRRFTIGNPGLVEAYCYRLQCHKELGEYDKALDLAEHIIHLVPQDASGYAFKSDVLEAQGDHKSAAEFRERALKIDPEFRF